MTKKHDGMDGDTFEYTRNSYFNLSPAVSPEEIVYLSPDSDDELTHFNPKSVYVIGCYTFYFSSTSVP